MTNQFPTETRPLCVDLDGTLVKTDTFAQALLLLVRTRPVVLFSIPRWAAKGLASLKQRVAQEVLLDPSVLPVHPDLLRFLRQEHAQGRELILVTASDEVPAQAIADHIGLFADVMASDGVTNLKGKHKRDALMSRFGENGFDYAGNSKDDLVVWAAARETIVVNPSWSVRHTLRKKPAGVFEDRPSFLSMWFGTLRISQWIKNSLIFLPMLLAHELTDSALYIQAILAFFAFSFTASAIYILNDLLDLHADQHHPRKRSRPLATGNLGLFAAVVASPVLLLVAFALSAFLPGAFAGVLLIYLLITTFYSLRIKQIALLDVITLAGLYTIRILAGTAAYGVPTSPWLVAFSIFIFFSLAIVKRYAELLEVSQKQPGEIEARGRGYRISDIPLLATFGAASGCVSVLVLALYINSEKVVQFYKTPEVLWLFCPILLYWIARIWLLAMRGEISDDPLDFAARDPQTWAMGALGALILIAGTL